MTLYEPFKVLHKTSRAYKRFILDENTIAFQFENPLTTESEDKALKHIVERTLRYFKHKFTPAPWESIAMVIRNEQRPHDTIWVGLKTSNELTHQVIIKKMIKELGSTKEALLFMLEGIIEITFAHIMLLDSNTYTTSFATNKKNLDRS